jgi:hypothetical protein
MSSPVRVIIPIDSNDPAAWSHATAYVKAIGAQTQPASQNFVLLTHTKNQLKGTSLESHIGGAAAKALLAGTNVSLPSGGQLRHMTLKTLGGSATGAVIIAYYADDGMLDVIDGLSGIIGIVAVPELLNQIKGWIARWNPHIHGQQPSTPAPLITDPVIENALTTLSGSINLANAVLNPRDKEHANETLRILRAKGHALPPDKIKSWAIKNGWDPKAAEELAKLADRIGTMVTKPSLKNFRNPDGKYESWRK